jgi:SAM domain (Sterile alpha motif)
MMDIAVWLRDLGLERYELAFREDAIEWEALPKLTEEDLKDLGVLLGSHRRKLLAAIAALQGAPPPSMERASAAPVAERRQLTVMFCDLVGSTELAKSSPPIKTPSPRRSPGSTALSPSTWAMGS